MEDKLNQGKVDFTVLWLGLAAFATYSCMYAFRKSFSVGVFEGIYYLGLDFKSLLIISQSVGYMLSKFIGIKFISELRKGYRARLILVLIGISELALILFAQLPAPDNFWCLFLNGLPLGMIWGIVFSYLEGRSTTELLGVMLSISFIMASNISKSVAQWLLVDFSISEFDMPYITGILFAIPLFISIYFLDKAPDPTEKDISSRLERVPMTASSRARSLRAIWPTMLLLVVSYILLTVFRDIRSNYSSDVWKELGFQNVPSIYITSSLPSSAIVILLMSLLYLIKNNWRALFTIEWMIFFGFAALGASSLLYEMRLISPVVWVISMMTATYIAYIPFNCFIFERIIPTFNLTGSNIGFLMYIADAFGYLGSVLVLFHKNLFSPDVNWLQYLLWCSYSVAATGVALSVFVLVQFYFKRNKQAVVYGKLNLQ